VLNAGKVALKSLSGIKKHLLTYIVQESTRVKLAVISPSRQFRDLAKKTPKQKRTGKLK